jgi:hypothetical protein
VQVLALLLRADAIERAGCIVRADSRVHRVVVLRVA